MYEAGRGEWSGRRRRGGKERADLIFLFIYLLLLYTRGHK
jgi:hypothetical protein